MGMPPPFMPLRSNKLSELASSPLAGPSLVLIFGQSNFAGPD